MDSIDVKPSRIYWGVARRRDLLSRGHYVFRLSGSLLSSFEVSDIASVPYLRYVDEAVSGNNGRDYRFALVDEFVGMNLSGEIRFGFARIGHQPPECIVRVPISGFLME